MNEEDPECDHATQVEDLFRQEEEEEEEVVGFDRFHQSL